MRLDFGQSFANITEALPHLEQFIKTQMSLAGHV